MLKGNFKEYFENTGIDLAVVYLLAAFSTEVLTLSVKFPYDLIKCRLQSVNYVFKYQNLPHAFKKEIKNNGVLSLYRGSMPFLATYASYVTLQFTLYERIMQHYKEKHGPEVFEQKEFKINMHAGLIAGVVAAAFTNGLEAITVAKQTNPELNLLAMIRKEGSSLLTKGLLPRVIYNGSQCVLFFNLVLYLGKQYNVNLSDD